MTLNEKNLFKYLKQNHYPDLGGNENESDMYDGISQSNKMYIELKSRYKHYDELMIEHIKYRALVDNSSQLGLTPWYINSTPKGIYAFDLSKVKEPDWSEKFLPKSTDFGDTRKKMKLVGYLNVKDAIKLA